MEFKEYHEFISGNLQYPDATYAALGLSGEAGEVVEVIKKAYRKNDTAWPDHLTPEERASLIKELGDVLWYTGRLAQLLGSSLEEVATTNVEKLRERHGV